MSTQNKVILSLGSNSGNKKANILEAINLTHNHAATIIKTSALYQTPSWGFKGQDFYNCALLVHTNKQPEDLLNTLLAIEKKMGRERADVQVYQDRSIDIDIISYNNIVINSENLKIPHPHMYKRNFVLLPVHDICPEWEHPVLLKNIEQMIKTSADETKCTRIQSLHPPLSATEFTRLNYIAIEGNIGAGKTTLSEKIADDFNARLVLEGFADNPFLPRFYKNPKRYAFSLEMAFLADRYQQLKDDLAQFDLFKDFVVADYHIFKSLIFAKVTLGEDEYRLYRKLFDIMYKDIPKPDLYVYLHQNTDKLLQNIRKRGRSYEQEIQPEYLENINRGYIEYIKSQKDLNVLIIDVSDKDFVKNQEDYIAVLQQINAAVKK